MRFNPTSGLVKGLGLVAIPVLAVLLALPGTTYAQSMTGALSGSVVDESGGVIPGADVTVTNEASKALRRTVTNSDGFFAFASLPASTYTVSVKIAGFNSYEVTRVELRSGDSRSLRQIQLKVATVAETVSVSAEVALTPLNSGEKSATLTSEQIENIPIMGTSAAEVLRLLPGMTGSSNGTSNKPNFSGEVYGINGNGEGGQQSAIGNYSANGNRTWALDITIDGAPGADPGCNCASSVNPNTEFVQEFKVLQANFGAEHAKGPVAMSVISKQGGRDFHGSVFGYFRNYNLNSNEWFANKVGAERVKNKFTYPGFSISGPVLIPGTDFNKNRDKVFFFAGFEYFGQALDTGYVKSWVPTQEMRNGNFSNAAAVGSGSFVNTVPNLPGGIMPASQINTGGQALLNMFQLPNANPAQTGGYNYVDNLVIDQNGWQGLARLDFNVSDNTKLFVRYNIQRETQPFVIGLWWRNGERQLPYPSSISGKNRSDSVSASLTHVFDPTLTNETIFAVTYINFPNEIDNRTAISRDALGYPYQGVFGESNDQVPSVDPGGWGNNGPLIFNPGGFDPILFAKKWQISAQDNLTKVWGLHTVKLGGYYEHVIERPAQQRELQRLRRARHVGGRQHRQHVRRPAPGRAAGLQRVLEEHRQRHALQPVRGLRPGLLEAQAPTDRWTSACACRTSVRGRTTRGRAWPPGTAPTTATAPASTRASPGRRSTRARRSPAPAAAGSTRPRASALRGTPRATVRRWFAAASACTATTSLSRSTRACSLSAPACARSAPGAPPSPRSKAWAAAPCRPQEPPSSTTTASSRSGTTGA